MICFAWNGFPQYAARCVGELVKKTNEKVVVVATTPSVPIKGMEDVCGCEVIWVKENCTIEEHLPFKVEDIKLLIVSGWATPAFNLLSSKVKSGGGKVVAMVDNNYFFSFKEVLRAIRFRLLLKNKYDGFFVPGKSGRKLLRFYGVKDSLIKEGMYSADAKLFFSEKPLSQREKKIIFVGQLCNRKNVLRMIEAFRSANDKNEWKLELYGCGPLKDQIKNGDGVSVYDFLQPEQLAEKYREARAFCLGSVEEHWGLVVHEAALSGCVLLLSDNVGAKEDLLHDNGYSFEPHKVHEMTRAFQRVMSMSDDEFLMAQDNSIKNAVQVNMDKFVMSVQSFM